MKKKKGQLDFYTELARKVTPDPKRPTPQVWFQHVAILRKLDAAEEHRVQRIPLHRGLNILWAPPENPSTEVKMYEDGISGHASGKTLFCRLLRSRYPEATVVQGRVRNGEGVDRAGGAANLLLEPILGVSSVRGKDGEYATRTHLRR